MHMMHKWVCMWFSNLTPSTWAAGQHITWTCSCLCNANEYEFKKIYRSQNQINNIAKTISHPQGSSIYDVVSYTLLQTGHKFHLFVLLNSCIKMLAARSHMSMCVQPNIASTWCIEGHERGGGYDNLTFARWQHNTFIYILCLCTANEY